MEGGSYWRKQSVCTLLHITRPRGCHESFTQHPENLRNNYFTKWSSGELVSSKISQTFRHSFLHLKMASLEISPQLAVPKTNGKNSQSNSGTVYDLLCVGFGTAALGLAVALQHGDNKNSKVLFLESKPCFEQTANCDKPHMETCFAQDLASLRDPTSKFTFLNYLHTQGKLENFLTLFSESPYPVRKDFNEYLEWSAKQFGACVEYGREAIDVAPVSKGLKLWTVTSRDVTTQEKQVYIARNVIMATGGEAKIVQHLSAEYVLYFLRHW